MRQLISILILVSIITSVDAQILGTKRRLATENEIFTLEVQYGEENLKEVLWYISDPIEIQREIDREKVTDMKALMDKGKVKISGGKVYEVGYFVNSVSGLFYYKKDDRIAIRFENEEGRFLEFQLGEAAVQGIRYYNLKYETDANGDKFVDYGGEKWKIISGSYVKLEYKADADFSAKTQKTKIRGLNKDGSEKKGLFGN